MYLRQIFVVEAKYLLNVRAAFEGSPGKQYDQFQYTRLDNFKIPAG